MSQQLHGIHNETSKRRQFQLFQGGGSKEVVHIIRSLCCSILISTFTGDRHTHTTQHNTRWLTGIEERIYSYIRIKKRDKKGNIGITKGRRGETERERREKIMLSHLKWFRLKVYKGEGV